jgi:protein-L-isoaspartate O-methyltransferase
MIMTAMNLIVMHQLHDAKSLGPRFLFHKSRQARSNQWDLSAIDALALTKGERVLDIGCGCGQTCSA